MLCLTCPGSCAAAVAGFVGMGCRSHIAIQEPPPAVSRLVAMEDLQMSELDPHDSQARAFNAPGSHNSQMLELGSHDSHCIEILQYIQW